ncbi:MAG: hypothetical protein RLZZ303_2887 [Candidatus Hydrogenedentota bacterium]
MGAPRVAVFSGFEQHLLRAALVEEDRLRRAKAEADHKDVSLAEALVQLGYAEEQPLYEALADFCEMRFVAASKEEVPPEIVAKVPARYATHYGFVPLAEERGALKVAISDPLNTHLLDDIRMVLKQRIVPVVSSPRDIQKAIKQLYGVGADTMEKMMSRDDFEEVVQLEKARESANLGDDSIDASIIKFVNELILEAVQSDTTDIHIEPFEEQLRVRYRIDGILHQAPVPPAIRGFHAAIVSRVKIMANLNIAEKRLPQDGKILATLGDQQYDLRVSILPTPHGETVNMRILNRASVFLTLDQLGFLPEDMKLFNGFISKPHGIILVTGPTGSGKTTTLYAALSQLNKIDRKIITIEDPIEYQIAGITQMQVLPKIGFDFSMGLRSMLRHDPDIMLVGEIRDYETAEMAIRSSLTGHLVLSTLHTNDSAGAVTRLTDMGVEPFLISSTVICSIAQRLVRRICPKCSQPAPPDLEVLKLEFGVTEADLVDAKFLMGAGCDNCRNTGYRGRAAIYEIMPFTPEIKRLTVERKNSIEIKDLALAQGMKTLRKSGWLRVVAGMTTIEEVLRVTADAEVLGGATG